MNFPKLNKVEFPKIKAPKGHPFWKSKIFFATILIVFSLVAGGVGGFLEHWYFPIWSGYFQTTTTHKTASSLNTTSSQLNKAPKQKTVVEVVKEASPAVVSIIISKNLPVYEKMYVNPFPEFNQFLGPQIKIPEYQQKGTKKQEVGAGTGFIINPDGLILTNKHVVSDKNAEYVVLTNDGKRYPAKVLARDPVQDLAVIKIERDKLIDKNGKVAKKQFPILTLGNSSSLELGQKVVAIGNALGEFRNTVSVGVISGLGRRITASGGGLVETLEDVIQTDAAINRGNSGGPLLNLQGKVIGINVAMAAGAQSIGFAIPINKAKRDVNQIKTKGKIVYPFLGVRYLLITPEIQKENNLSVDYGALIVRGNSAAELAVVPGSAADKAGLKENDIILEIDGQKITPKNSLSQLIQKYNPGDKVTLKVLEKGKEKTVEVTLGERSG